MANLENRVSEPDRRALSQRTKRQLLVLQSVKNTQPAQIAMRLRKVADRFGEIAIDKDKPTDERVSAAKAMMEAQAQLLDVIGWPKRPTPAPTKPGRLPPPVDITPDPLPQVVQDLTKTSPESGI